MKALSLAIQKLWPKLSFNVKFSKNDLDLGTKAYTCKISKPYHLPLKKLGPMLNSSVMFPNRWTGRQTTVKQYAHYLSITGDKKSCFTSFIASISLGFF